MDSSRLNIFSSRCHSCQYEREASDKHAKHRCPSCKKPYLVSYKQAEREGKFNNYTPNHIPLKERLFLLFLGIALIFYSFYGLMNGELHIPTKNAEIAFYKDGILWGGFCLFTMSLALFVSIIDHYDKRDNEIYYSAITKGLSFLAGVFLIFGSIVD